MVSRRAGRARDRAAALRRRQPLRQAAHHLPGRGVGSAHRRFAGAAARGRPQRGIPGGRAPRVPVVRREGHPTALPVRPRAHVRRAVRVHGPARRAGERGRVLRLDVRAFSYWDVSRDGWTTAPGCYRVLVGASSRDIRLRTAVPMGSAGEGVPPQCP
ncbi:MAG: hypothetical protein GEV03_10470 [Streptosporangiales bacterium]|nr:hypothetical protein [Streptosporangiales bacterium]